MDKVFPEPARLGLTQGRKNFRQASPDMKEEARKAGKDEKVQQEGQGGTEPRAEWPHPSSSEISPPAAPQGEEIPPGEGMDTRQGVQQAVLLSRENPWA